MIEIKEYKDEYAEALSKLITQNLLEINSKDYGLEYAKKTAADFTAKNIKQTFPKRTKTFIALENNVVVGTAGIDKSWYSTNNEYYILSVFVDISKHKKGIGKKLINKIEEFAKTINAKKLIIPSSIYACEFYHKLGYEYTNGKKQLNEEQMYTLEKPL